MDAAKSRHNSDPADRRIAVVSGELEKIFAQIFCDIIGFTESYKWNMEGGGRVTDFEEIYETYFVSVKKEGGLSPRLSYERM